MRLVASRARTGVALGDIFKFCTGADDEPPHGFAMHPTIQYVTAPFCLKWAFIPTANTCSLVMTLPKCSHEMLLPDKKELFEVYVYAF